MRRSLSLLLLVGTTATADIDSSAYNTGEVIRGEAERKALQRQIETERQAEVAREAGHLAESTRLHKEATAREAARPYPERLTEQQCTLCHTADSYASKQHTWLYWRLVVARMVWLNDAAIAPEAQAIITDHLASIHPARDEEVVVEYGLPVAVLALLGGSVWAARRYLKGDH